MSEQLAYTAVVVIALSIGYYTGSQTKITPVGKETRKRRGTRADSKISDAGSDPSSSGVGNVTSLMIDPLDECKMVLVVRADLNMSTGKIAAQCSHATLACYKLLLTSNPAFLRQWERSGQTKIALKCQSEEELLTLQAQAESLDLCARSIQDAGRTQIAAGSRTVLGIAGPARLVNRITSTLRLL
ncbi:hypothetical protein GYMLUDRAFT_33439 [Collybiopsis luxurians FD-317 M1]|nr:hypothetical protein GYMLUDRAFT_33439 [Collybiopsis luxurians FD-317 M1]